MLSASVARSFSSFLRESQVIFWAACYVSDFIATEPQVERLTTWWPGCTQDTSRHSSEKWPQRNVDEPGLELEGQLSSFKQDAAACDDQFRGDSVRADWAALSLPPLFYSLSPPPPPPAIYRSSHPLLAVVGMAFWTGVHQPASPLHCQHLK